MPPEVVQTKRDIEALLAGAGLHPRKRLGQNFLIDGNLMRRLARKADLSPGDLVLEVGAGTGGLTDLLAGRAVQVLAVEIDSGLHGILVHRYRDSSNVMLILGDILASKHRIMPEVASAIGDHVGNPSANVKLVANLPYQVATPVVMNLLVDYPRVGRFCFTVQAEVGDRITAAHGCKAYGPLSILAQTLCETEVLARIPAQAFWPRPSVESVMIRLDVRESPFAGAEDVHRFALLVRRTFEHRRKTLRSALGYVLDDFLRDRVCAQFDSTRRPEQLAVCEWMGLFHAVGDWSAQTRGGRGQPGAGM